MLDTSLGGLLCTSFVKSGLVIIMCHEAIIFDILAGSIPKLCCLDEFIGFVELYIQGAVHVMKSHYLW